MLRTILKKSNALLRFLYKRWLFLWFSVFGPPRVLNYREDLNADILRYFGASVGHDFVRAKGPITLHFGIERGRFHQAYANLTIEDGVALMVIII